MRGADQYQSVTAEQRTRTGEIAVSASCQGSISAASIQLPALDPAPEPALGVAAPLSVLTPASQVPALFVVLPAAVSSFVTRAPSPCAAAAASAALGLALHS